MQTDTKNQEKRTFLKRLSAILALAFCLVILYWISGTICPFYAFIGLPCPTCGFTRALVEFFRFNIARAFTMHPLFWLMGPLVLFISALYLFKRKAINKFNWLWQSTIAAIMLAYVLRLIFSFPRFAPMCVNDDAFIPRLLKLLGII